MTSSIDWSTLVKLQDQIAKSQDYMQKQRSNQRKILYKNDLQQTMTKNKKQIQMQRQQEKQFYKQIFSQPDRQTQKIKQMEFQQRLKQSSEYNLETGLQRKSRLRQEIQCQKQALQVKFKTLQTQMSTEKERNEFQRVQKQKQLAKSYEKDIGKHESLKKMQKMQNQRFEKLAQQLQNKKEQQRRQHINKIKYGYGQDPQAFNIVQGIYQKNQHHKNDFFQKMTNNNPQQRRDLKRQKHHLQTIQTSKFNKNQFMQRQNKRKQQYLMDLQCQQHKIIQIQQQITQQSQRQKKRRSSQRSQLKTQLQQQISQEKGRKIGEKRMSQQQGIFNNGYLVNQYPMIPGISVDYRQRHREEILDNFMRNNRASMGNKSQPKRF